MVKIFAAVLVACVALIVVFQFIDPNVETAGGNAQTSLVNRNSDSMNVTVSGEVTRPGTYVLDLSSTMQDLISSAGGITTNADVLAYNTSYVVEDGASYYIGPKYNHNDVCSMEPIVKTNINKDDEAGLQVVSGIGSTIAKAIVSYRNANGQFGCIEDLKKVTGIGNATFEKIKDYVRLSD